MDPTFDDRGTRGISGKYYVHTFTDILPDDGEFIIIQENAALEEYKNDDDVEDINGVWTKTKKYTADPRDTDLKVLVKTGEDVKVTVKILDDDNVVAVSVYELDASKLEVIKKDDTTNYGTASPTPTVGLNPTTFGLLKSNFKVVDTQKLLLEYEDEVPYSLGEVIVDEDVVVIDARNGEIKETTFSALRDEVAEDGYVYVIPFANEDAEGYSKTSFDVNKVEANVLVIVD